MEWHDTKDREEPKGIDESIPCVCDYYGTYKVFCWNTHYKCWDDCYADDYVCNYDCVSRWAYIDEPEDK